MLVINPVAKLQTTMTHLPQPKLPLLIQSTPTPLPPASAAIQGSSKLAPIDVDADDLASMTDMVASIADTVESNAAPPAASTATQGSSKLTPVDVDADDLASMTDTADAASEPSSDSSSDSSISEDPPDDTQEVPLEHHKFHYPGATYAAPPDHLSGQLRGEEIIFYVRIVRLTT